MSRFTNFVGEAAAAVASHIDRRTLAGVTPEKTYDAFRSYKSQRGSSLPEDDPQVKLVSALMANMMLPRRAD